MESGSRSHDRNAKPVEPTNGADHRLAAIHAVTIRGDSYRLREKRRSDLLKPAAEPSALAPSA